MRIRESQKGISLIVLIITIAVIIILASAVILSVGNNRPIESAKEATQVHNEATLKESAAVLSAQWKTDSLLNDTTKRRSEYVKEGLIDQGFTEEQVASVQVRDDGSVYLADAWDGTVASSYASGDGSQANPYKISSSEEFAYLSEQVRSGVSYENKYLELTTDLDLNNMQFEIIGLFPRFYFNGSFNGNNHKIYNLNLNMSEEYSALFLVQDGTIENLVIESCEITSSEPANAVIACLFRRRNYKKLCK